MDNQNPIDTNSNTTYQENPISPPSTNQPIPQIVYAPTVQATESPSIDNQPTSHQQQTPAPMPGELSAVPDIDKRKSGSFTSTSYIGLIATCSMIAFFILIAMSAGPGGIGPALIAVYMLPMAFVFLILTLFAASKKVIQSRTSGQKHTIIDTVMFLISFIIVAFIVGASISSVVTNKLRDNRCEQNAASGKYVSSEFADAPWRSTECDGLVEEY